MKWENYFLKSGEEFPRFWNEYLTSQDRNVLFIMGMGMDPRTNNAIKSIYSIPSKGTRSTIALRYYKYSSDQGNPPIPVVQKHIDDLTAFLKQNGHSAFEERKIIQRSDDDKSVGSINATQLFVESDLLGYSDIVVDISAIPRGIFLPLINKLLVLVNGWNSAQQNNRDIKNLHVIVTENPELDSAISDKGEADEAMYVHGLSIIETSKNKDYKEVWIALLGEKQTRQFNLVNKDVNPVEICIVLPFPSEDLRRSDKLVIEYQDYLFNEPSFDPKNIIYADERNPFQVYRLLHKAIERYNRSLGILNGCKVTVSAFSSKLLTVGAFLAVFESKLEGKSVGIKHVESLHHELDQHVENNLENVLEKNNLVELWIAGIPYE